MKPNLMDLAIMADDDDTDEHSSNRGRRNNAQGDDQDDDGLDDTDVKSILKIRPTNRTL